MKAKHILIADDESYVVRVLRFAFEKQGYRVEAAPNGAVALKMVLENPPDLLITDMVMPRLTGKELCHAIHESFPERKFPIWVMTSRVEWSDRNWIKRFSNIELFDKPVSPRLLMSRMVECFEQAGV